MPLRPILLALLAVILVVAPALLPGPTRGAWAEDEGTEQAPLKIADEQYPPEFRARVNRAVDKGVEFLMAQQSVEGSWPATKEMLDHRLGHTALMTLACLKGGVTVRDPQIRKAFAWMRTQKMTHTYDVGVLLMALHALYSPTDERQIVEVDKYGERKIKDPCLTDMTKEDRAWMQKGVDFLLKHQEGGHWRYPENGVDLSNTQYALLGLWAASRCGFKIPSEVWMTSLDWLLKSQERQGRAVKLLVNEVRGEYRIAWTEDARARGFRYIPGNPTPVTGAMTTAGMASVAICQDELWGSRKFTPALRAASRRSIRDALAWMQDNFDVTRNPGEPEGAWHYYYLYGIERAGMLARSRFMGSHDWYFVGAEWLLQAQRSDGGWHQADDAQIDTAFGILFLKRSSTRTRNPVITSGG
ncbi:MAG: hypothetical protein O2894_09770 [Planctomycetota bacterium]|nr:hypothetical protein [Planctomycetota bacterium]